MKIASPALLFALVATAPGMAFAEGDADRLADHYYLQGATEVGSELLLAPDGRFEWITPGKGEVALIRLNTQAVVPPAFSMLELRIDAEDLVSDGSPGRYVRADASSAEETP